MSLWSFNVWISFFFFLNFFFFQRSKIPEPFKTRLINAENEICGAEPSNKIGIDGPQRGLNPHSFRGAKPLEAEAEALELEAKQLEEHADALEKIVE